MSSIWMVYQVTWLYPLNTGHPYCRYSDESDIKVFGIQMVTVHFFKNVRIFFFSSRHIWSILNWHRHQQHRHHRRVALFKLWICNRCSFFLLSKQFFLSFKELWFVREICDERRRWRRPPTPSWEPCPPHPSWRCNGATMTSWNCSRNHRAGLEPVMKGVVH